MTKECIAALMVVALAATGPQAAAKDEVFTGAVSDNWAAANNWYDGTTPDSNDPNSGFIYVGCPEYPNKSATIYTGTNATSLSVLVGGGDQGSLTIQSGATLSTGGGGGVGGYDNFFGPSFLPFPISDENDWVDGGTGTLTISGTLAWSGSVGPHIAARGDSKGTVHLNSGGLIDMTGGLGDMYVGMQYHEWRRGGYYEFYHADGATVNLDDNLMMAAHHDHSDSFYKFVGGGVFTVGKDMVQIGNFNNWNGVVWVDGGTATINVLGPWGSVYFINYSAPGQDSGKSGDGNDVPVLRLSGNDPLLKINGPAAFVGAKLELDANTLVIPGWQWVTVVDANSMAEHTDWTFSAGANVYESNDLTFAAGVDTNIWSMKTDNDKVQIKVSKRGDMDKDSRYTTDDINPFVLALTDPNAYLLAYGIDPNLIGDIDYSGKLDTDDISPFVMCITGGASAVPEPACIGVIALGAAVFIRRRRRKR